MGEPSKKLAAGKGRLAWFPFYPGDWLHSQHVACMPIAAKGLYIQMLAHSWISGPLPADEHRLAKVLGIHPMTLRSCLGHVRHCWQVTSTSSGDYLVSPRLEEEREKAIREREKAVLGAEKTNAMRTPSVTPSAAPSERPHITSPNNTTPRDTRVVRSRPRAPRTDPQGLVLQHFEMRYLEAYGKPYAFEGAKDGAAIKRCLKFANGDVPAVLERIDRLFADPFWASQGGLSLSLLASQWNRLAAEPTDPHDNTRNFVKSVENYVKNPHTFPWQTPSKSPPVLPT